ncbi:MAG: hydantoinase/oxoprolinase N-terminal domain-containing protein [Pseudomonadales bacterium]
MSPNDLLTTAGFAEVLYLRNGHSYDIFVPQIEYPERLIARFLTSELAGRTYADGSTGDEPSLAQVETIAAEMKARGVESIAVCLLNSYRNPAHEQQVALVFANAAPEIALSLFSDIALQMLKYVRTSTKALNVYTLTITRPYLTVLIDRLRESRVPHEPLFMLSNGGVVGARVAGIYPSVCQQRTRRAL